MKALRGLRDLTPFTATEEEKNFGYERLPFALRNRVAARLFFACDVFFCFTLQLAALMPLEVLSINARVNIVSMRHSSEFLITCDFLLSVD